MPQYDALFGVTLKTQEKSVMGLAITSYESVVSIKEADRDEEESFLYVEPGFLKQAIGLTEGLWAGRGHSFRFNAGSYSGYNAWRKQLALLAGYGTPEELWANPRPGPFVELINFSDCEGVISSPVCNKLATDFAQWQSNADAVDDDWFREKYADWRKAFELAANGGAVSFH